MSRKLKVGRGALVRRLRREYGLNEGDARIAAASFDPDVVAARSRERARSRADELKRAPLETDFTGWRHRVCPQRPAGWCLPDDPRPAQPWGPEPRRDDLRHGARVPRLLAMAAALGAV